MTWEQRFGALIELDGDEWDAAHERLEQEWLGAYTADCGFPESETVPVLPALRLIGQRHPFNRAPSSCRPHIPKVVTFRVVRRRREFWIEAVEDDGSRRFLERCDSLEEANQRLEEFRINAERIERRASSDEPHSM